MRNFRLFYAVVICSLLCLSCGKVRKDGGEDETPASIEINVLEHAAKTAGGSFQVELQASHDWVSESEGWISVTPDSGNGSDRFQFITVNIDKNPGTEVRRGTVRFVLRDKGVSKSISITQEGDVATIPIADFCKKTSDKTTWYNLRGVITSIEGEAYGDLYIKDDTGEILVYGMTAKKVAKNDGSFSTLGLKEGDILTISTLKSEYRGEAQAGGDGEPAYYIKHVEGTAPAPVYRDFKAASAKADWMELPATSETDAFTLLHHGMKIGSQPFRNYTAYWDKSALVSNWVAYPLTRKSLGYGSRTDAWAKDPLLEDDEQPILTSNYKAGNAGSGFTRGHQLPSADRLGREANTKTFYFTNMTPQDGGLNGGVWETLESKVRTWAKTSDTDTLYVVTGCMTKGSESYCLDNKGKKVTVPVGYYKALLRLSGKDWSACAFWIDHKSNADTDIKKYAISIDALEEKTGVDFFVNLPAKAGADAAAAVEAANPLEKSWWWK